MKRFLLALPVILAAGSAWAQNGSTVPDVGGIDAGSIFARQRGSVAPPISASVSGAVTSRASTVPFFVGSIMQGKLATGFLEITDARGTRIIAIHEGDTIAWDNSRVLEIGLSLLQLSGSANSRLIHVGNDLKNQPRVSLSSPAAPASGPVLAPGVRSRVRRPGALIPSP